MVFQLQGVMLSYHEYLLACRVSFFLPFWFLRLLQFRIKDSCDAETEGNTFLTQFSIFGLLGAGLQKQPCKFQNPHMIDFTVFLDNFSLPVSHMERRKSLITLFFKRHYHKHLLNTPQGSIVYT